MADTRPLPPPLEARCPDCSICGKETGTQDNEFVCEYCCCSWPISGIDYDSGEWNDPEANQCTETVQPYLDNSWVRDDDERKHQAFQCVRDADHVDSSVNEVRDHANPDMQCFAKGWV